MTHAQVLDLTKKVDEETIKDMPPWTYQVLSGEDKQKRLQDTVFKKER